jgi:hypothetical protein
MMAFAFDTRRRQTYAGALNDSRIIRNKSFGRNGLYIVVVAPASSAIASNSGISGTEPRNIKPDAACVRYGRGIPW